MIKNLKLRKNEGKTKVPTNGKMFSSTYQPKSNGRKPSKLRKYIKENNISRSDISLLIKNLVLSGNTEEELKKILLDQDRPMLVRLFVRAFLDDFKKSGLQNFSTFMTHVFGLPKQDIEVSGGLDIAMLTKEEREAKIRALLEKKYGKSIIGQDDQTVQEPSD